MEPNVIHGPVCMTEHVAVTVTVGCVFVSNLTLFDIEDNQE